MEADELLLGVGSRRLKGVGVVGGVQGLPVHCSIFSSTPGFY